MTIDNLTRPQIEYLWLCYQYANVERGFNTNTYQTISLLIYNQMKEFWSKMHYEDHIEICSIQECCDAMRDIAYRLKEAAMNDQWLATVKI